MGAFFAADFLMGDFFAADFLMGDFFAADFFAGAFFAGDRFAGAFRAVACFPAVFFAAAFFAAAFLAGAFFTVDFLTVACLAGVFFAAALPAEAFFPWDCLPAFFFGAVLPAAFFAAAVPPLVDFPLEAGKAAAERAAGFLAVALTIGLTGVFLAGVFFAGVFFTVPPFQPMGMGVVAVPRRWACHWLSQARRYSCVTGNATELCVGQTKSRSAHKLAGPRRWLQHGPSGLCRDSAYQIPIRRTQARGSSLSASARDSADGAARG
jgi:hypothetical protein